MKHASWNWNDIFCFAREQRNSSERRRSFRGIFVSGSNERESLWCILLESHVLWMLVVKMIKSTQFNRWLCVCRCNCMFLPYFNNTMRCRRKFCFPFYLCFQRIHFLCLLSIRIQLWTSVWEWRWCVVPFMMRRSAFSVLCRQNYHAIIVRDFRV